MQRGFTAHLLSHGVGCKVVVVGEGASEQVRGGRVRSGSLSFCLVTHTPCSGLFPGAPNKPQCAKNRPPDSFSISAISLSLPLFLHFSSIFRSRKSSVFTACFTPPARPFGLAINSLSSVNCSFLSRGANNPEEEQEGATGRSNRKEQLEGKEKIG